MTAGPPATWSATNPPPHGPRLACGRVLGRLQLELCINLGAEQNDVERDVKPEQQNDDGAKRPVEPVVVGEVRYVEREGPRSDQPNHHGKERPHAYPLPFGTAAASAITVEDRKHKEHEKREEWPPHHADDELEGVGIASEGEQDRHIDDGEKHDHGAKNADDREGEGIQIVLEEAPALGLFISNIQSGHHTTSRAKDPKLTPRLSQDRPELPASADLGSLWDEGPAYDLSQDGVDY